MARKTMTEAAAELAAEQQDQQVPAGQGEPQAEDVTPYAAYGGDPFLVNELKNRAMAPPMTAATPRRSVVLGQPRHDEEIPKPKRFLVEATPGMQPFLISDGRAKVRICVGKVLDERYYDHRRIAAQGVKLRELSPDEVV